MAGELKQIKDFTQQVTLALTDKLLVQTSGGVTKYILASAIEKIVSVLALKTYTETVATPSIVGGTLTLDLSTANVFNVAHNANITSLVVTNAPASGISASFTLNLTQDATGGRTFTYSSSVYKPAIGVTITLSTTANTRNKFVFDTTNGGTTWDMSKVGSW